jgi:carbon dioxide concentrating mechanism protein CcmL
MQIAKVLGMVVSTHKTRSLTGIKLLLLQFIDAQGELLPKYEVAGDIVGAGVDEWVLVTRGSAARQESGQETRPLDALVVGIIDTVTIDNRPLYSKKEEASALRLLKEQTRRDA